MYADDHGLVLSPTDLTKHLACAHLTTLDLAAVGEERLDEGEADESLQLIFRLGLEHEKAYLRSLVDEGRQVIEISDKDVDVSKRVEQTDVAMRAGAEVIYQAAFLHGGQVGFADFLLRVDRPSLLGDFSYDVADTKLARKMKVAALLQMAEYGRHLERIQGAPPEWLIVITGDKKERAYRYDEAEAYARRATAALRHAVESPAETRPEPNGHCAQCRWSERCEARWEAEDHLSLVAFMRTDQRLALELSGVRTVRELANSDPLTLPSEIGRSSRVRLQDQAALQILERDTNKPHYRILEALPDLGLLRLPEPSKSDVYLDFEGDPYANGGEGREYLAGIWNRAGEFTPFWAHSYEAESQLTIDLLADLVAQLDADPSMHIYHYAPYERSALARLTQRHQVGEREFDRLLRAEALVDLYAVVRQGLRVSKGSYSIKKLEAFYWDKARSPGDNPDDVANALDSVVAYEKWLVNRNDQSILDNIESYNRDDVRSTHDLHQWLEDRRTELEVRDGSQPRPVLGDATAADPIGDAELAEIALADELLVAGHDLLAGLVAWYRREGRPQWWDFYRLKDLTDEDLVRDNAAIGRLSGPEFVCELPKPARSSIWRYTFEPQDTKVSGTAYDVDTHMAVGAVHDIDAAAGWIELKVATAKPAPTPRGLGPRKPVGVAEQQGSIQRTARAVLAGRTPFAQQLIDGVVPRGLDALAGETPRDIVVRVGVSLDQAVLAVQGPPGAGKTTAGGDLIRALLDRGLKVGVTAQSHAVIGNLLKEAKRPGLQKCDSDDFCGAPGMQQTNENKVVVDALASGGHQLVGGTAWLWSREDLAGAVDVLIIDEAGQFSLANAVAVAQAAHGLVLLGDPQQLAQPSQTEHKYGAGVSALQHILGEHATMPPDRGVFLDSTWRMHPNLTGVVSRLMYEGRLKSVAGLELQELVARAPWGGAGVRWLPISHAGREASSPEEALAVQRVISDLVGARWVDAKGKQHRLGPGDILVVAPYNAQVALLRAALPDEVRVGTVDKFQGQEAPVVIYSMASSSVEDAPRGVSFLYDRHRLNVAISRARCAAIVVASPLLLDAAVRSPDQLRDVNGLIQVVEQGSLAAMPGRAHTSMRPSW